MLRIVIDAGVIQLDDSATGFETAEPAVVAVDRRTGLPLRAGWAALDHDEVTWPLESLDLANLDPEPRRSLLAHLLRTALSRRPWWDRIQRPTVTLVIPPGLSAGAIQILRTDAGFAGAARNVRIEAQVGGGAPVRPRPTDPLRPTGGDPTR